MKISPRNIHLFNHNLRYEDPPEIISFVLEFAQRPLVTTSFGPYSASLLHAVTAVQKDVEIVWCDTGYNTDDTYSHANKLIERLELNIEIYSPRYTTAYLDNTLGRPDVHDPRHALFSERVKLEPFRRALEQHRPDVWFTNVRKGQTDYRNGLDILSFSNDGVLKVSPFYHFDDERIKKYLEQYDLPAEYNYFDPVKALEKRECGIHLQN
ncbi:phosphoadenosine phosphosulfate reductase family protein [Aureitalea sp. L0-47]|uniref:phosphoadenosine phosphosulfate reductase domain-containing protein n=1 Tax=Aureitalea sp. L0-47 TaxID=2816962 RepID=UPI0022390A56|nr:phosphoadenosine phosphosulfate reductase family protein [Aureitalea sp. L0-47]MCW5520030.1 phosphoadenosine phosphosulfate reductase family protein [Aureitalea sp. L0-47]